MFDEVPATVEEVAVFLVERAVNSSSSNGIFGIIIGLFAFFHVAAMGIVLSAEADVVRHERLWPRALLTPFTDNVDLTDGDRRSYTRQARISRFKGYQHIDVGFDPLPETEEPATPTLSEPAGPSESSGR